MFMKDTIKGIDDTQFVVPLLTERTFAEINTADYVKSSYGDSFAIVLSRYYAELRKIGLTETRLGNLTGLQSATISLYLNGKRIPTVYSLSALCIGMRLYYPRSLLLMKKAGLSLDEDLLKDRICMKYLIGCGFDASLNVDSCNRELLENGFSELSKNTRKR